MLNLKLVLSDSDISVSVSDSELVKFSQFKSIAALDSLLLGDEDGDSLLLFLDDSLEVSLLRELSSVVFQFSGSLLIGSIDSLDFLIKEKNSIIVFLDDDGSGGFSDFIEFSSSLGVGSSESFEFSAEEGDFSLIVLDLEDLTLLLGESDSEFLDLSGLDGDDLGESLVLLGEGIDLVDSDFDLLVLGSEGFNLLGFKSKGIIQVSDFLNQSLDVVLALLLDVGYSAIVVSGIGLVLLDSDFVVLVLGELVLVSFEFSAQIDDFFLGVSVSALVVTVLDLEVLEFHIPLISLSLLLFEEFDEFLVVGFEDGDLVDSDVLFGEFSDSDLEGGVSGAPVLEFIVLKFDVPSESIVFFLVGADFLESSLVLKDLFNQSGVIGLNSFEVINKELVLGSVVIVVSILDLDIVISDLPFLKLSSVHFLILE